MAEVKETVIVQGADAPEVVETKDTCAARIRQLLKNVRHDTIQIGFELLKAKKLVKRGSWGKWLKTEFAWTQRTANNFMRIAERFGKMETGFQFQATTLQEMLALPVGEEEAFVEAQAAAGRPVENQTKREVKANVKAWKERAAQTSANEAMAEQAIVEPEEFPTEDSAEHMSADTAEPEEEPFVQSSDRKEIVLVDLANDISTKLSDLLNFYDENIDDEIVCRVLDYLSEVRDYLEDFLNAEGAVPLKFAS